MPLIRSRKSGMTSHSEMNPQAFASGYQRMARGGMPHKPTAPHPADCPGCPACYAMGGEVDEMGSILDGPDQHPGSQFLPNRNAYAMGGSVKNRCDRAMSKLKLAYGGRIANDTGSGEADRQPNERDVLVKDDDLDFEYDAENSGDNDIDDSHENERRKDTVERALRKHILGKLGYGRQVRSGV